MMARITEPRDQWIDPGSPSTWDCDHADKEPGHTTLYVIHSMLSDDTLYVGITGSVKRRFKQHRRDKAWWGESELASLECYDSWESACEAEFDRIKYWKPVHNIIGNEMRRKLEASLHCCYVCGGPFVKGTEDYTDAMHGHTATHTRCDNVIIAAYEMGCVADLPKNDPRRVRAELGWESVRVLVQD